MSKVICDVCGASYDSAAGACPLCGWKPGQELNTDIDDFDTDMLDAALADTPAEPPRKAAFDYDAAASQSPDMPKKSPVISKKAEETEEEEEEEEEEEKSGTNIFLVILLILLILALLGVSVYLLITRVLKPGQIGSEDNKPGQTQVVEQLGSRDNENILPVEDPAASSDAGVTQDDPFASQVVPAETVSAEPAVPCTNLTLVGTMDKLTFAGQYWRLMVRSEPTDTTDTIVYTSGDESIVTIDEYGRVTAVGEGTTTITVTCGEQRLETTAVVDFGSSAAAPADPAAAPDAAPAAPDGANAAAVPGNGTLKIMYHGKERTDLTLTRRGVYITLELDGIPVESATWRTTDSSVATVNNGNVTAMGRGQCAIIVTYNGQTAEAIVRCKW